MLKRQIDNSHDLSDITLSPAYGISFQTVYLASSRQTHFFHPKVILILFKLIKAYMIIFVREIMLHHNPF